ncbi:MAG: bifunctional isocitrate dehydrogenase kinase/phosphatase [Chitinophagales bacterium]|nr:bifunctional isocitrate dehydrogenase kinase/phosphatase [Chitinophagales bacterium]
MGNIHTKDDKDLIEKASKLICGVYDDLLGQFMELTSYGKEYFEKRMFAPLFEKQQQRYRLYGVAVKRCLEALKSLLEDDLYSENIWIEIKKQYSIEIQSRTYTLNCETFFNSITRKVFFDRSFNSEFEYFDKKDYSPVPQLDQKVFKMFKAEKFTIEALKEILLSYDFNVPFEDIDRDTRLIFDEIAPNIISQKENLFLEKIEFIETVFFRNRGAYLVGRLVYKSWTMPLVIPILNEENGLFVDSVISTTNEISIIFSFTRASFFAYTNQPAQLIDGLKLLLPNKSVGELYDSIGFYRHGKTILYRDLMNYIHNHDDQFIIAPGIKGMVMAVFTLKYYNFVFKIIKDKFDNPKTVTREQVIKKYEEVEINDRVGRLAYAHLFEHLEFPRHLFSAELEEHLKEVAKETVEFKDDVVIVKHVYLERKMTPLNLYHEKANPIDLCRVILDYGFCVKELAAANIFPGDLLMKNFGVTRHGRVIFYDYDEISEIKECNFRRLPQLTDDDDMFGGHMPEISVNQNDIFPEEFKSFMAPSGPIGDIFLAEHDEIFDPKFWRDIQKRIIAGEYLSFFAYDQYKRFRQVPRINPLNPR